MSRAGRRVLAIAGCVALAVAGLSGIAAAKKKKSPATTKSLTVGLSPGSGAAATASCPKNTHVTGGGYTTGSPFTPSALTGTRTVATSSHPAGLRTWDGAASAYVTPTVGTTLTTLIQCEQNSVGKIVAIRSGGGIVAPGTIAAVNSSCPADTHALSGGFTISAPPNLAEPTKFGVLALESRRTAVNQWTVTVLNPLPPAGVLIGSVTGYALCEANGKGQKVKEVSAAAPIVNDSRATVQPTCSKKYHVVSGGFLVTPNTVGGSAPAVSVDQQTPVGKKAWKGELYEAPGAIPPAGSTFTGYAYCKKG